ncbi:MAG: FAD-binding oxidoreductase [Pseudomonadota bacterium]
MAGQERRDRSSTGEDASAGKGASEAAEDSLLARFAAIVGARHVLCDAGDIAGHLVERRGLYTGATRAVVRPGSVAEVSAVLALASETGTPIVPQGGNTGLVGGQIPFEHGREIILSLSRLDAIRSVDRVGGTLTAEAGVTLRAVQEAAEGVGHIFPLSLASEGTCQIGGNLATNAGGMQVLAYGNARDLCLGLEVVLADGRVWNGLRALRKDNTGYDLRDLFIGSEGTLGVITAAVLRLFPSPGEKVSAFVGLEQLDAVAQLYGRARSAFGSGLTRFELLPRIGVDLVLKHMDDARDPLASAHPWYAMIEVSHGQAGGASPAPGNDLRDTSQAGAAEAMLLQVLETTLADGIATDGTLAASGPQEQALWDIREGMSDVQSREGGSIKNDVAVPVADVPAFITEADRRMAALVPGCRPVPFGHFGDGNIHYNILQPVDMARDAFIARWDEVCGVVNEVVHAFGGTISAEHGIGRMKRHLMAEIKDPVELALMRSVKATFDPKNILNPGKVV